MKSKPIRVYTDTSVFGGIVDSEFTESTGVFFNKVRQGKFHLIISALVQKEINDAPLGVREFFKSMLDYSETAEITEEAVSLKESYLTANTVTPKFEPDALHVA